MKNMINPWRNNTNLALTLIFFLSTLTISAGTISGSNNVCAGEIITYSHSYTPGNTYNWGSTGASGIATINTVNGTAVFTVTWGLTGPGAITLQEYAGATLVGNHNINISINNTPNPLIVSNFDSDCVIDPVDINDPILPSFECETVCEDSPVTYTTSNTTGNTYQWTVIGSYTSISGATTNTATVTWGSPGQAFVVVTETTLFGCTQTDTTCIIIADKPISEFEVFQPNGSATSGPTSSTGDVIEVCLNSTVCFNDLSVGASSWFWDFGNANTSNLQNPCETFTVAGSYQVMQIVENECHCADTSYLFVEVSGKEGPDIVCQSVVCNNGTFTYDAILPFPCTGGYYEWSISNNGIITAASGSATINPQSADGTDVTSITVNWGSGPDGTINLTLNGCAGICESVTSVNIPIVPNDVDITGDETVCVGESGHFKVPCFPGTSYTWHVGGNHLNETGNEIWYEFPVAGNYAVEVDYGNDFLGCSGNNHNSFNVIVLPSLEINGPATICQGSTLIINGPQGSQLTWVVTNHLGTIVTSSAGTSSENYEIHGNITQTLPPGTYTVTAQDANSTSEFCNDAVHQFTVIAPPPPPTIINGSAEVCIGETYIYTSSPTSSDYYLVWRVLNSGANTTSYGSSVTVTWGTGMNSIRLYQVYKTSNCGSSLISMSINPKQLPTPIDIFGSNVVCANTEVAIPPIPPTSTYSTPAILDGYDWSIIPANAGSVVAGQGTNTISVIWNNYTGSATPSVVLTPTTCNISGTPVAYPVNINNPTMSINGPTTVCQNSLETWSSLFVPLGSPSGHTWTVQNVATGASVTLGGTGSSVDYNFPTSGSFVITGSAINCSSVHTVSQNVTVNPAPVANLTYSGNINCINQNAVTLFLSMQGAGSYSFDWLMNGSSIGLPITTTSHSIGNNPADAGNYSVRITNTTTGCISITNIVKAKTCNSSTPTCVSHISSVSFTYNVNQNSPSPGCDVVLFNASSLGSIPTQLSWNFAGLGNATGYTPSFQFPASGIYPVTVVASYGGLLCDKEFSFDVVVPVIADFEINISCAGGSMLNVNLINTSDVFFGPFNGANYTFNWSVIDISGPTTVASSLNQDFTAVPNLSGGTTYDVELVVTRITTGDVCTFTETFLMPENATADFNIINPIVCEGNPVAFADQSLGNIIGRRWLFGDTPLSTILTTDPEKTYTTSGIYTVTLEVTDEFGCVNTSTAQQVDVRANTIAGNITMSEAQPMCPGLTTSIDFNHTAGGFAPYTYLWSNNTTAISTSATQTSTHYLGVTDAVGCFASFGPETVQVVEIPDAIITGVDKYCVGDDINLTCNYGPGYGYTWYQSISGTPFALVGSIPVSIPTQLNLTGVPGGNHVFKVELNTSSPICTKESFLFNVEVFGLPSAPAIITSPTPACSDGPVLLEVNNPALFNSISWSTGDIGNSTTALSPGRYYAVGTDVNGCSNSDFTDVHELPNFCSFMCGCYSDCIEPGTSYTFPGIPGTYSNWRWESYDGSSWSAMASGTGTVNDLSISTAGAYLIRLYVETTDGCDGYSCEVDLMLANCNEPPCDLTGDKHKMDCFIDRNLDVNYYFSFGVFHLPFGTNCGTYTYSVIPASGTIDPNSLSTTQFATNGYDISGVWNTGLAYHRGGQVCFDIIVTNSCDQTSCMYTLCFEIDPCGDPDAEQDEKSDSRRRLNGNSDNLVNDEVLFYPNPTTGMMKIKASEKGNYQITIFDISGKIVVQHNMLIEADRVVEFNLSNLPVGPYSIQCVGNEAIKIERLIILKE